MILYNNSKSIIKTPYFKGVFIYPSFLHTVNNSLLLHLSGKIIFAISISLKLMQLI